MFTAPKDGVFLLTAGENVEVYGLNGLVDLSQGSYSISVKAGKVYLFKVVSTDIEDGEKLVKLTLAEKKDDPVIPDPTEPPTAPTEPPTVPTEPPTAPTEPPTVPTEPPTAPTEPPTVPTEPPAVPTEPSTVPSKVPTIPYESSTQGTEPAGSSAAPVDTIEPEGPLGILVLVAVASVMLVVVVLIFRKRTY